MIVLETERLILRRLVPDDLDALARIYADPDVMQFTGGMQTRAQSAERLGRMMARCEKDGFGLYATTLKSSGEFIGRCGFIPWTLESGDEIEVAWLLAKHHWGRGLGTEAARALVHHGFTELGLQRLISLIVPGNTASLNIARKIGMQYERDVVVLGQPAGLFSQARPQEETALC